MVVRQRQRHTASHAKPSLVQSLCPFALPLLGDHIGRHYSLWSVAPGVGLFVVLIVAIVIEIVFALVVAIVVIEVAVVVVIK